MMIQIENVTFSYPKFKINDVSFDIEESEIVAIVGNNASGKTTLIQLIAGLLKVKKGKISIDGLPVKKSGKKIGIVFQNPDNQIIFNNVYDDITFTLKNFNIPKSEFDERVDYALALVGMSEYKDKETFSMSTGQKQRIVIANMLAIKPDIIIFDEASAYLDSSTKQILYKLFLDLKNNGVTVIFTTNLIEEIVFADKIICMENGKLEFIKTRNELLQDLSYFRQKNIYLPLKLLLIEKYKLIDCKFDDEIISKFGGEE